MFLSHAMYTQRRIYSTFVYISTTPKKSQGFCLFVVICVQQVSRKTSLISNELAILTIAVGFFCTSGFLYITEILAYMFSCENKTDNKPLRLLVTSLFHTNCTTDKDTVITLSLALHQTRRII